MDIQSEKLDLIQWVAGLDDLRMIKLVSSLKLSNESGKQPISSELKSALHEALQNIEEGKTMTQDEIRKETKKKFPQLFK